MKFYLIIFSFSTIIGFYGCSNSVKKSECEALMDRIFLPDSSFEIIEGIPHQSDSSEFVSGGCIDSNHAYLYPSDWPTVLMFVSVIKDTFMVDSIIDFNNSFKKYANMKELEIYAYGNRNYADSNFNDMYKLIRRVAYAFSNQKYYLSSYKKFIYRKKDYYQLVTDDGIYKISFKDKKFEKQFYLKKTHSGYTTNIDDSVYMILYDIGQKVYFSPEYTKITFIGAITSSITVYENGKFTVDMSTNITPGLCLSIGKVLTEEEKKVTESKNIETVEIVNFGLDCK